MVDPAVISEYAHCDAVIGQATQCAHLVAISVGQFFNGDGYDHGLNSFNEAGDKFNNGILLDRVLSSRIKRKV